MNAHFIVFITLPYAVVQVLFVPERDHWVTTSYHEGEVRLYDSKFNHVLSDSLKEQIAIIYKEATQSNVLTVRAMPVQQQTGGEDCGLFAIAFAYHAALGENLGEVTFEQKNLRQSLVHCFEQNCLQPFSSPHVSSPHGSIAVKRNKTKRFRIHLICTCRLPESSDYNVIQCDQCQQWYHFRCMGIQQRSVPASWLCINCQSL